MEITSEQKKIVEKLRVERLSSNPDNIRLVEGFYSVNNQNVANALLNEAFGEDENGSLAYYVVKDDNDRVLFFFSLKCGQLFDEFIEGEKLSRLKELCQTLTKKLDCDDLSSEEKDGLNAALEAMRSKKGLKKENVARILKVSQEDELIEELFAPNVKSVGKTFAGIEIVHFCKNDEHEDLWETYHMPQKLGPIVFWEFIVPRIFDIQRIVGCEYLFLFAADCNPDEHLVNYYRRYLKFGVADEHSAAIPLYDFTCKFMYQEISQLACHRDMFYKHFNPDDDAV